ncbi:MAG: tyrosine-type recombinase/integrase [Patescibacteria group bacterium]
MNVENLLIDYLEFCEIDKNLSQDTIKMYHYYLNDFLAFSKSHLEKPVVSVKDISLELIQKYRINLNRRISAKSHESLKRNTQKTFLVAIRAFLKYLIVKRSLDTVAPAQIDLGKDEARVPKYLNGEQLERIMDVQNLDKRSGVRDRAILEVLFSTGLRVSELVKLNRDSINVETREFAVVGKGRKLRTVYLSQEAIKWLDKYFQTRNDDFKPLFLRYSGRKMKTEDVDGASLRLTVRSVQRLVKKYALKSGISVDATPHSLRHSMATNLLLNGADLRSVQELLGHTNVSTTQIYTHITNKRLKDVHDLYLKK